MSVSCFNRGGVYGFAVLDERGRWRAFAWYGGGRSLAGYGRTKDAAISEAVRGS